MAKTKATTPTTPQTKRTLEKRIGHTTYEVHMTAVHLWQNGTLQFKKGGENAKIMRFPQLQSTFCYK